MILYIAHDIFRDEVLMRTEIDGVRGDVETYKRWVPGEATRFQMRQLELAKQFGTSMKIVHV